MELSNTEIVTIAIIFLEGFAKPIDIEDIAIKAFEIAPTKFCWKKYSERIDLRVVQDSLKKSKKNKNLFFTGSIKNGFQITRAGLNWFKTVEDKITYIDKHFRKKSISDHVETEKNRIRQTNAYKEYKNGNIDKITNRDFEQLVRINDYFPIWLKRQRYNNFEIAINNDEELQKLWDLLKKIFIKGGI